MATPNDLHSSSTEENVLLYQHSDPTRLSHSFNGETVLSSFDDKVNGSNDDSILHSPASPLDSLDEEVVEFQECVGEPLEVIEILDVCRHNEETGSAESLHNVLCAFSNLDDSYFAEYPSLRSTLVGRLRTLFTEHSMKPFRLSIGFLVRKLLDIYYVHEGFEEQDGDEQDFDWLTSLSEESQSSNGNK